MKTPSHGHINDIMNISNCSVHKVWIIMQLTPACAATLPA